MRFALLLSAALLAGCARASADEQPVMLPVPPHELALDLGPRPPPPETLDAEVLAALRAWTTQPTDALVPWAHAIVDAGATRVEAIRLASLAARESKLLPWVLDGSCNDAAWRAARTGWQRTACDNGWARGAWQRHSLRLPLEPDAQARDALQWLRAYPQAWTTWRGARAQADAWLAAR